MKPDKRFVTTCVALVFTLLIVQEVESLRSFKIDTPIKVPICSKLQDGSKLGNESLLETMFYIVESHLGGNVSSGNGNFTFSTFEQNCKIRSRLSQLKASSLQKNDSQFSVGLDGQLYYNEKFISKVCLDLNDDGAVDIFSCNETLSDGSLRNCTESSPCIRKCCSVSEYWDIGENQCQSKDPLEHFRSWTPPFYNWTDNFNCVVKLPLNSTSYSKLKFKTGLPKNCYELIDRNTIPSRNIPDFGLGRYRLLVDGSVLMNYANASWIPLSKGTFCVDEIYSKKLKIDSTNGQSYHRSANVLLVCKEEYKMKGPKRPIPIRYAMMLFTAALILSFTVLVYLLVWDKHNIYEWTVFFEVLSMIFMIVFLATSHTIARDPSEGFLGTWKCVFLGMASHYFFIATFFWLLVINFEIWWNFRTLTISNTKSRKWLRLFMYHLFAWGGPAIIVLTGWILDKKYGLQNDLIDCTSIIVPNYGQLNCYISKRAQGPYLYYPMGVLLFLNLVFYSLTAFKMCQYQRASQRMTKNKSNGHYQPIVVFARLFIVMGVSWVSEIVAWALSPSGKGKTPIYWIVFDIVSLVQAIAIFLIFVCRKEILWKLQEKYKSLNCILDPIARMFSCVQPQNVHSTGNRSTRTIQQIDLKDMSKSSIQSSQG